MSGQNNVKVGRNIIYQMIYQIVTVLSPLIVTPYLSRTLGPSGIGKYSYAYSIAYYFVLFAGLGITSHGSRKIAEAKNNEEELNRTFSNLFWIHLFISLAVTIIYFIAVCAGMNKENSTLSFIMTFYVLSAAVDVKWFFYGIENFKITVLRSIIIRVLYIVLIFIFVNSKADTWRYTFIMAFVAFFLAEGSLFILLPKYVKLLRPNFKGMIKEIAPLFILFIPSVANLLLRHFDKIMLGMMSTYEQLGMYENTDKVFTILSTTITAASDVILPRISNLLASKNEEKAEHIFNLALRISIIVSCAFAFGLMAIAKEFVPVFFGNEFLGCISLLSWIAPTIIMTAFSVTIRKQYLIPRYKEKVYTIATCTGLAVNIVANYFMIPNYGAMGAVYGTLIAEFVVIICQFLMIHKEMNYLPYVKDLLVFISIGIIMLVVVRLVSNFPINIYGLLLVEISAGALIYLILTLIYLAKTNDEIFIYIKTFFKPAKSSK